MQFLHRLQSHMLSKTPDDTESLICLSTLFDVLLRSFGLDEDDLYDFMEEHKTIKRHREDKMRKGKKHYESVLVERIVIQQARLRGFF